MTTAVTPLDMSRPTDLICMGRVAVDFYADQVGSPLDKAQSFSKYLGGCAGNISVGTSRLGLKSAMFSCIGMDDMGLFLKNTLEKEGVDTSLLTAKTDFLTALVILGVDPPDRFPLIFYRENCADMQIQPQEVDAAFFKKSKALLVTGTGLSTEPMRKATLHAVETAKSVGTAVIMDIDYRPVLWGLTKPGDGESRYTESSIVTEKMQILLPYLDLIVGTEEEIRIMGGGATLQADIEAIRKATQAPIVVKTGEKGCIVYPTGFSNPVKGRPYPVDVLNVLGAGDAFMSGFLRGWLRKKSWETCAQLGNANGALVVSRHGCAPAMASYEELTYFMEGYETNRQILLSTELAVKHQYTQMGLPRNLDQFIISINQKNNLKGFNVLSAELDSKAKIFSQSVFEGFQLARKEIESKSLTFVTDLQIGSEFLKKSTYQDFFPGINIDVEDVFTRQNGHHNSLFQYVLEKPSYMFIKYTWDCRPDHDLSGKNIRLHQLKRLYNICVKLDRRLLLELIVSENDADREKKQLMVIEELYQTKVFPFWWSINSVDKMEWDRVCRIIDKYDAHAGIIIRSEEKNKDQTNKQMDLACSTPHGCGFIIGLDAFQVEWNDFTEQRIQADEMSLIIKDRYLDLIRYWQSHKK